MVIFAAVAAFGYLAPSYASTARSAACGFGAMFDMLYDAPKGLSSGLTADAEFCSVNCVCKGTNAAWAGTSYASHAVVGGFSPGSSIIKYADCSTTAANAWKDVLKTAPMNIVVPVLAQAEN